MSNLTLALPSKGRLKENAIALFEKAGFEVRLPENTRSYQGSLHGVEGVAQVDVAFLSASEIARELVNGKIDVGVTGEDLARETIDDADSYLDFVQELGFGHADVVIGIPDAWVDVETMADLDDVAGEFRVRHGRRLRIATKYWQLTQRFLASHGIDTYRIVESLGATEAAPAAGQADVIVDITSSGATLRANGLKIIPDGVILKSQANLIVSRSGSAATHHGETLMKICHSLRKVISE